MGGGGWQNPVRRLSSNKRPWVCPIFFFCIFFLCPLVVSRPRIQESSCDEYGDLWENALAQPQTSAVKFTVDPDSKPQSAGHLGRLVPDLNLPGLYLLDLASHHKYKNKTSSLNRTCPCPRKEKKKKRGAIGPHRTGRAASPGGPALPSGGTSKAPCSMTFDAAASSLTTTCKTCKRRLGEPRQSPFHKCRVCSGNSGKSWVHFPTSAQHH